MKINQKLQKKNIARKETSEDLYNQNKVPIQEDKNLQKHSYKSFPDLSEKTLCKNPEKTIKLLKRYLT